MTVSPSGPEILEQFRARQDEMVSLLSRLVMIESPSREPHTQGPLLELLAAELEKAGMRAVLVPGTKTGGYLYARPRHRRKRKPLQLLVGHCDTVWPVGTLEKMPLEIGEDTIKGPGVFDMKAGLTQIIFALKLINELGIEPEVDPLVLINSDEEIGSRESRHAIMRLARIADRALVLEPPLGLEGKLKTARKGIARFTIVVKGEAAHAGLDPGKGVSAIVELSHQIQTLFAMNDPEKGITVNVGMVEGGLTPNMVAPESRAVIDVRVQTRDDAERLTEQIRGLKPTHPEAELAVEGAFGRPPMEQTSRNRALWDLARELGYAIDLELEQGTAGGGSDGNYASLHTATLDGLGTRGDGAHAPYEFIYAEGLPERAALLTLLLLQGQINNND